MFISFFPAWVRVSQLAFSSVNRTNFSRVLLAVTLLLFSVFSHAGFIDNDTYLSDSDSGLDWLDLSFSFGQSYNDVSTELSSGG